ncbi:DNA transposition protein [Segnochrobactrum spirostomi]|uniref:DNA transposition protein n=1 Tax=Segnochrobactrum spirostomi TaxID=2608987 RepID=A0A6A7Y864_9HYPH|nr:DNA transposition protein [Segnochrobactrum spirostomi]MQT13679.1 DNA transposition protein [Segnochrobactrum spirostomi]
MARRAHDDRQGDLLAWEPPEVVERFEPTRVRAATWRDRIARTVAATLEDCALSRDEIASRMSTWLGEGEEVSRAMLDNYASQAKSEHTISFLRALALIEVTGDTRLLQLAAEPFGKAVIEERYLGAIEAEMVAERMEDLEQRLKIARRRWKGPRG